MRQRWYAGTGLGLRCGARLSGERGRCRAWVLKGKRRCKWHGGKSTGPRDWRTSVAAMAHGRARYIERRHAWGMQAPGGRPSRIPVWLRRALVEECENELGGVDLDAVMAALSPDSAEITEGEQLAELERLGTAILLERLRLPVYRSEPVIRDAAYAAKIRRSRVERGDRARDRLDELIEYAVRC